MRTTRLRQASESFWVLPTLLSLGAIALAELLLAIDRHVVAGEPLARSSVTLDDDARPALHRAFTQGPARSPHQDAAYAVQQLTEMAVRALSAVRPH